MKSILKTAREYIEAYKSGLISFSELLDMIEYLQTHALFTWCSSWEAIDQALIFFDEAEELNRIQAMNQNQAEAAHSIYFISY